MILAISPGAKIEANEAISVADWSFCAICSVEKTGDKLLGKWYRYKPKKIYWGSIVEASDRLFAHRDRFNFADENDRNKREYLILIGSNKFSKGGAIYRCVPISDQGIDARWIGDNKSTNLSRKELNALLDQWVHIMRKKYPMDKADQLE
jgi:hypothetical protein